MPHFGNPLPKLMAMGRAADWEEDTVKSGMMLNLMPIPYVFEMNEIIPTRRTTDNSA